MKMSPASKLEMSSPEPLAGSLEVLSGDLGGDER
jgi:hypothetical protein